MNIKMNYHVAAELVKSKGIDVFFKSLQSRFPDFNLYSCSVAWLEDCQYICKAKGLYGDVVIYWE